MKAVYKCRLCGEKFTDCHVDFVTACQNVTELIHGCLSSTVPDVQMHQGHECASGDLGVADLQGWVKEAED